MLSVVIATKDSERALVRTLSALVPGASAGVVREVIVVDDHSQDDTLEVADIAGCQIMATTTAPLGERLKSGAKSARGDWLLFLQPGIVLAPVWIEATSRFMEDGNGTGRAATFRPATRNNGQQSPWSEILFQLRLALVARPQPQQGLLIAKPLYNQVGGHRSDSSEPERDLMRTLGRRIVTLKCEAIDRSELPTSAAMN